MAPAPGAPYTGVALAMMRPSRFHWFLLLSALLIAGVVLTASVSVAGFFKRQQLTHLQAQTGAVALRQARRHLTPRDFQLTAPGAPVVFQEFLAELPGVVRIKVFDAGGRIVWANEPRLIGLAFADNRNLARALRGEMVALMEKPEQAEHIYERSWTFVAEAYVPITFEGSPGVVGVIETYTDVTDLMAHIRRVQVLVWMAAGGLGIVLWAGLALIVARVSAIERRALRQLERQHRELAGLHQFTQSVLQPLDLGQIAARVVQGAAAGLGLAGASIARVAPGRDLELLARWPETGDPAGAEAVLVAEALRGRRALVRAGRIVAPVLVHDVPRYVFVGALPGPAAGAGPVRTLEIMLHEAGIALSNVDLFTQVSEAHQRLAAILAGVADWMVIIDRDMRVVWTNPVASEHLAGGDPETVRRCFDLLGVAGAAECDGCPAVRAFTSGRVERGVRTHRLPSGQARYLDLVAAPLRDPSGQIHQVLEVARDITELVEMDERLKQSNRELREAQAQLVEQERLAAIGQVVVGLHHAILNPLAGALGGLQVLQQPGLSDGQRAQLLREVEDELRRIEQLVRRLPAVRSTGDTAYVGGTTMIDVTKF